MTAGPGGTQAPGRLVAPDSARAAETAGGAQHGTKGRKNFRGDIEGLRAIAVGTVLIYHVGIPFMPGGFVGVDIFFVISGFLITSLLVREASATGTISIADFYARRARRLLPPASTVLLFTALAGWLVLPGSEKANLGSDVVAATFYVVNWALALRSVDYLAEDAAPSALQHYWSLSVEEQFYVFWPLIIIVGLAVARRTQLRPKPLLLALLSTIALASFVYSVVHTQSSPETAYFYTTTRVWELAIGAVLAFLVTRLSHLPTVVAEALAGLGVLLILYSAFFLSSDTPWPGSWALAPTVGAALVIAGGCASQTTATARLLSLRPMVWIGGLSYAIYLWHWPLITLAEIARPGMRLRFTILIGLVSVVLAWLTKHIVEDPIRFHPGLSAKASRGLLFGLCAMLVTALAGATVYVTVPKLDTDAKLEGATQLIADPQSEDWEPKEGEALDEVTPSSGEVSPDPAVAPEDVPVYYDHGCQMYGGDVQVDPSCVYADKDSDTTIAMIGDSKMGQWFPAVEGIAEQENWRLQLYLKSTCPFTYEDDNQECATYSKNVIEYMKEHDAAPDIALVSFGGSLSDKVQSGGAEVIEDLEAMGTKVVMMTDSPRPALSEVYTCVEEHPKDYSECGFPANEDMGREGTGTEDIRAVGEATGTTVLDLNEWICPPGDTCPPVVGDTLVYRQGSHVTASYIRTLTPILYRSLADLDLTERSTSQVTAEMVPASNRR